MFHDKGRKVKRQCLNKVQAHSEANIAFPMIIYFSVIEIGLYSVYRKLVLATLKLTEKK